MVVIVAVVVMVVVLVGRSCKATMEMSLVGYRE